MPREERETLGAIFQSKKFFVYILMSVTFQITVFSFAIRDIWSGFYENQIWGTYGLLLGNFLGFYASNVQLISWILVDENSWLGKALMLLVGSLPLTICGAYFTIEYFNTGYQHYKYNHHHKHNATFRREHANQTDDDEHKFSDWMPILAGINFIQGVIGILFFILVCMSLDGEPE